MSPSMRPVPAMHPSQFAGRFLRDGGIISATGLPNRVTRIGIRVLRTRSKILTQLALNSEKVISSTFPTMCS
jgi:hypothetical protein